MDTSDSSPSSSFESLWLTCIDQRRPSWPALVRLQKRQHICRSFAGVMRFQHLGWREECGYGKCWLSNPQSKEIQNFIFFKSKVEFWCLQVHPLLDLVLQTRAIFFSSLPLIAAWLQSLSSSNPHDPFKAAKCGKETSARNLRQSRVFSQTREKGQVSRFWKALKRMFKLAGESPSPMIFSGTIRIGGFSYLIVAIVATLGFIVAWLISPKDGAGCSWAIWSWRRRLAIRVPSLQKRHLKKKQCVESCYLENRFLVVSDDEQKDCFNTFFFSIYSCKFLGQSFYGSECKGSWHHVVFFKCPIWTQVLSLHVCVCRSGAPRSDETHPGSSWGSRSTSSGWSPLSIFCWSPSCCSLPRMWQQHPWGEWFGLMRPSHIPPLCGILPNTAKRLVAASRPFRCQDLVSVWGWIISCFCKFCKKQIYLLIFMSSGAKTHSKSLLHTERTCSSLCRISKFEAGAKALGSRTTPVVDP